MKYTREYLNRFQERFNDLENTIIEFEKNNSLHIGKVIAHLWRIIDIIKECQVPVEHQNMIKLITDQIINLSKEGMMAQINRHVKPKKYLLQIIIGIQKDLKHLASNIGIPQF